jgi:hypothetical protein
MKTRLLFLHTAYWIGILLDAGAAILLMFPSLSAVFYHWSTYQASPALGDIAGEAAALMWGWTFLLYWADRKPVERRGVLLLTVFPVLFGLMATRLLDVRSGLISWFPAGMVQPALVVLFLAAYFTARKAERGQPGKTTPA